MNEDIIRNTVCAVGQTARDSTTAEAADAGVRVLFMGNSITLHEPNPAIGWNCSHGMAASSPEHDYVHVVLRALEEKYGSVSYCITNVARWERNYIDRDIAHSYTEAKACRPDIVIFRLGENTDRELLEREPMYEHAKHFFEYYAEGARQVVVTDLFWEHEGISAPIRQAAADCGYTFVSIEDLGADDENKAIGLFEHEGVALHPGDLGMARIAERILGALGINEMAYM